MGFTVGGIVGLQYCGGKLSPPSNVVSLPQSRRQMVYPVDGDEREERTKAPCVEGIKLSQDAV